MWLTTERTLVGIYPTWHSHRGLTCWLGPQIEKLGVQPSLAFITYDTPRYVKELASVMRVHGQMGSIVEDHNIVPIHDMGVFLKALSFHWEFMFAKTMHKFKEETQGAIVDQLASLAADGTLISTVTKRGTLGVASLRDAHVLQESGKAIGKITLTMPEVLS
jgi:NADPH2:quinone reductase